MTLLTKSVSWPLSNDAWLQMKHLEALSSTVSVTRYLGSSWCQHPEKIHTNRNTNAELALVVAKTLLVSSKMLTISKDDFQVALLASSFETEFHCDLAMEVTKTNTWKDSTVVPPWLHYSCKLPVFSANGLTKILKITKNDERNHLQTSAYSVDAAIEVFTHSVTKPFPKTFRLFINVRFAIKLTWNSCQDGHLSIIETCVVFPKNRTLQR